MSRKQVHDKKKFVEELRKVGVVSYACKSVNVPRATIYRWREDDEEFDRECDGAIEEGKSCVSDQAESNIIKVIAAGSIPESKYWLERHHPAYRKISYTKQLPSKGDDEDDFSPEEWDQLIAEGDRIVNGG